MLSSLAISFVFFHLRRVLEPTFLVQLKDFRRCTSLPLIQGRTPFPFHHAADGTCQIFAWAVFNM